MSVRRLLSLAALLGLLLLGGIGAVAGNLAAEGARGKAEEALDGLGRALEGGDGATTSEETAAFEAMQERSLTRGFDVARTLLSTGDREAGEHVAMRERGLREEARTKARTLAEEASISRLMRRERLLREARAEAGAAAADEARMRTYGFVALAGVAMALLVGLLWRRDRSRLSVPLEDMADVMDEVAAGEERRIAEDRGDVLGGVPAAFNRMADTLHAVRRDLEASVDTKTAALGAALHESRELNDRLKAVLEELESTQEKLVQQEKMVALGTLARGISHEFNNLLGGIRGCAEDLLQDMDNAASHETLQVIVRAARRGRTIVEGLQLFSQSADRPRRSLDVATVLRDVERLQRHAAEERGIELTTMIAGEAPIVHADPDGLQQVLVNLVVNALQASRDGGRVELVLRSEGDVAVVEVRDRGAGIPAEHRERVFDPFFTTREREGGAGLGLAISHGIVQGLGGTLRCESREGGGTVFRVAVPLDQSGGGSAG